MGEKITIENIWNYDTSEALINAINMNLEIENYAFKYGWDKEIFENEIVKSSHIVIVKWWFINNWEQGVDYYIVYYKTNIKMFERYKIKLIKTGE